MCHIILSTILESTISKRTPSCPHPFLHFLLSYFNEMLGFCECVWMKDKKNGKQIYFYSFHWLYLLKVPTIIDHDFYTHYTSNTVHCWRLCLIFVHTMKEIGGLCYILAFCHCVFTYCQRNPHTRRFLFGWTLKIIYVTLFHSERVAFLHLFMC